MSTLKWTYRIWSSWVLLLISIPCFAITDNKVTATVDTNEILIGDWVTLTVETRFSKDQVAIWPIFDEGIRLDSATMLETISISDIDTTDLGVLFSLRRTYTMTVFDSGYYVIPPVELQFQKINGSNIETVASEPILLTVHNVAVDPEDPVKPIKDTLDMPFSIIEILYLLICLAVGVIITVVIIIYFLTRKTKEKPVIIKKAPKQPPHLIALEQLDRLDSKKLWQNDQVKEYHSELSEIVREYIENRYQILALESTTDEILGRMSRISIEPAQRENLRNILQLADFVKFAKVKPLPDEHTRSMKLAYEFVRNTIAVDIENVEIKHD